MAYAELSGTRLYYQVHGQGEALVLIPGMGADHRAWVRQIPAFRKRYRVVIFDPRGIGRTSRPSGAYAFRVLADDVAGLMDHLGIEKCHVLGQSLGGVVAQEVAIDHPRRVQKLVLVSTLAIGDSEGFDPALAETLGAADGTAGPGLSEADTRKTMNALIALSFERWPYRKAMQLLSRIFLKREMFDGLSDQAAASAGHTTIDRLHLIQAPTLVLTGTGDRIIRPRASERLASGIPGAKLVMVQGGSHAFNVEMAARFNREVLGFLRAAQAGQARPAADRDAPGREVDMDTAPNKKMAAVCGLFCPACTFFIAGNEDPARLEKLAGRFGIPAEQLECHGCRAEKRLVFCEQHCKMTKCAAERGLDFCGQCPEYPCPELRDFQAQMPHRLELWESHKRIREAGFEKWYAEMLEHYGCPSCRTINSAYDLACRQCGATPSCEYVRLHRDEVSKLAEAMGA